MRLRGRRRSEALVWHAGLLALLLSALACQSSGATPTAVPTPPEATARQPLASPALIIPGSPSPLPSALPSAISALPTPSALRLAAGELPPDSARLVYRSWTGVQAIVDGFQARCTRSADALGVFGSVLRGPSIGRFDLTIVPFHGSGRYRSDTTHNEVGGSISVTGSVQAYLGPPQESAAEVAADGALGEVRFATTNIDGRPLIGSLRWECSEVQA